MNYVVTVRQPIAEAEPLITVLSYKSAATAAAMCAELRETKLTEESWVATDESMKEIPSPVLVLIHNTIRPEKPVTRFADRATAEKRLKGVLEVLAKPGAAPAGSTVNSTEGNNEPATVGGEDEMATKTKGAKRTAKKTATTGEGPGRPSAFAGKKIIKLVKENPRREKSIGWKSWNVLTSGMTYEKYIDAGGRRTDLAWDLAHGFVKLEKA